MHGTRFLLLSAGMLLCAAPLAGCDREAVDTEPEAQPIEHTGSSYDPYDPYAPDGYFDEYAALEAANAVPAPAYPIEFTERDLAEYPDLIPMFEALERLFEEQPQMVTMFADMGLEVDPKTRTVSKVPARAFDDPADRPYFGRTELSYANHLATEDGYVAQTEIPYAPQAMGRALEAGDYPRFRHLREEAVSNALRSAEDHDVSPEVAEALAAAVEEHWDAKLEAMVAAGERAEREGTRVVQNTPTITVYSVSQQGVVKTRIPVESMDGSFPDDEVPAPPTAGSAEFWAVLQAMALEDESGGDLEPPDDVDGDGGPGQTVDPDGFLQGLANRFGSLPAGGTHIVPPNAPGRTAGVGFNFDGWHHEVAAFDNAEDLGAFVALARAEAAHYGRDPEASVRVAGLSVLVAPTPQPAVIAAFEAAAGLQE